MADLKLVGAVAIKVRPDAKGFRKETEAEVSKELAGYSKDIKVTAKVEADTSEAKRDVEKAEKEIEKKVMNLRVGLDYDSVVRAQKQLDKALNRLNDEIITIDFDDDGTIEAAEAKLEAMKKNARVEMDFTPDERGFRAVLAKIEQIRREKITKPVEFDTDDESLNRLEAAALKALRETATVKVSFTNDRTSMLAALEQIKAEQAKLKKFEFDVLVNKKGLKGARRDIEEVLSKTPVELKVNYDDQDSLKATRRRLKEMLNDLTAETVKVKVDEASLKAELAKIDALIKTEKPTVDVKVRTELQPASLAKAVAEIAILTKNQTVRIFTRVDTGSLLLAAAKLTGLRAASRWTEELARSIGTLDRNLPIVAAAVLTLSTLASGVLSVTANIFSLGNGIGEVVRMAGLLGPAMILGLGSTMLILQAVFKDFGAAIHGIDAAFKRLPPAGQEAAKTFRTVFAAARESISKEFWDRASDSMLRFSKTALPAVSDGLAKVSGSLGGVFSGLLDSFSRLTEESGVAVFFGNLSRGFDVAQTGLASFMNGFNTLAVVGSSVFPRLGRAFEQWAGRFDSWVQRLAVDGTLNRWIDRGIQGLKDLFNAGASLVKVWGNVGQAAQAAGALTLSSFARMMAGLERTTAGDRFQRNMANIFRGAREASDSFHDALGDLGPAMDTFSITVKNTLSGAGKALAAFIGALGDVMASPRLNVGITTFLSGIESMFNSLRPAAGAVSEILMTFGQILGTVARDSGPLFRNLFQQLAGVLTTAWRALEPFLPGLVQLGTTIINILGPAFASMAGSLIPSFASGLQRIGEGMLPLVELAADLAVGLAGMISEMPIRLIAGLGAAIVTLGTSFRIAATVVPLAAAAVEVFGTAAAISAARVQLMIPVVGLFLAALTGLAAAGIAGLATAQRSATPYANEYETALLADARAAKTLGIAVGDAAKQVAIKNLNDSGAFEIAKKNGISVQTLTDAIFGNARAQAEIQSKTDAANKVLSESHKAATLAAVGQDKWNMSVKNGPTKEMGERAAGLNKLNEILNDNRGSYEAAATSSQNYMEAMKSAGIPIDGMVESQKTLSDQSEKTGRALGEAAAASATLTDTFSTNTAKIDAMRKTLELLAGKNGALAAAENLGAYASGFQNLRDTVAPLAGELRKLGDAAYGDNGFLNVAKGNKAVLQVNQALVEQVNNTWAGAKVVYDQAIAAGKTAQVAFQESKAFIDERRGDYDQLAKESGLAADRVNGQWEAVFGKEWLLKITLSGATEAATKAQQMITALKGQFDGQKFQAYLDANPDAALKAITDANGAALDFVNHEWVAQIKALPNQAVDTIRRLTGMTQAEWNNGDFMATLQVAKGVPGLAAALQDIRNGVGVPFYANIFAQLNGASARAVQIALMSLTMPRTVAINVAYSATGDVPVARGGQRVFAANGGVFSGAGVKYFANGGIENHVAQITKPNSPIRIWSEKETHGEAYIPLASAKRPRSVQILSEVARRFGYQLNKAQEFANGGTTVGPTSHTSADVHIGSIHTVDMNEAVAKLRQSQRDALAVAGISSIGV